MRKLMQSVANEVLYRKVMDSRRRSAALMAILAQQRSAAFGAVVRFLLMRWKRSRQISIRSGLIYTRRCGFWYRNLHPDE